MVDVPYDKNLEDSNSPAFTDLAVNLEALVSLNAKDYLSIFVTFLSSTLFIVNYFEKSITLRISCGCYLALCKCPS